MALLLAWFFGFWFIFVGAFGAWAHIPGLPQPETQASAAIFAYSMALWIFGLVMLNNDYKKTKGLIDLPKEGANEDASDTDTEPEEDEEPRRSGVYFMVEVPPEIRPSGLPVHAIEFQATRFGTQLGIGTKINLNPDEDGVDILGTVFATGVTVTLDNLAEQRVWFRLDDPATWLKLYRSEEWSPSNKRPPISDSPAPANEAAA